MALKHGEAHARSAAGGNSREKTLHNAFLEALVKEQARWEEGAVKPSLNKRPEKKKAFTTFSGDFPVRRLYTPQDVAEIDYLRDIGFPGQFPYTRGHNATGLRSWEPRLGFYSGHGSSEDANAWYKSLIAQGARSVSLAMDLPTQLGYDSDHPMAEGEVGKVGVAVNSLRDMERIFDGVPLERIGTGTVGNCISTVALAWFYALGEKIGIPHSRMQASVQNDPFKEYTGRGTYIFPVEVAVDLSSDVVEFVCKHVPHWSCQTVCVTQVRWGGGSAAQEIAFGLANLIAYIEAARRKDVPPEDMVPRLNLHMTSDNDLFEEVAKFRAARRLWAKVAKERLSTDDPRVLCLRVTNFTAGHRMTAQQPLLNVIRTTVHVLACMLGGVEDIAVPAYDEALALPTMQSTRVANLTKHILHEEFGVANTVDPLGGSYFLESLTNQLEEKAREHYQRVEDMGGAIPAIQRGYYQQEMAEGQYRYQREVESGEKTVVGVNTYQLEEAVPIELFHGNPQAELEQVRRLQQLKRERDNQRVAACLNEVRRVCEGKAAGRRINVVPSVLEAVRAYATIGEVHGVMREVFGEYKPPIII